MLTSSDLWNILPLLGFIVIFYQLKKIIDQQSAKIREFERSFGSLRTDVSISLSTCKRDSDHIDRYIRTTDWCAHQLRRISSSKSISRPAEGAPIPAVITN